MDDKKPKTAEQPARRKPGRPPRSPENPGLRTSELADAIVDGISAGITLRQLCRDHGGISKTVIYAWMADDAAFAARIRRARELGFDEIAEQCLDIANTPEEGIETVEKATGIETRTGDMLGHRKLQIETRLKLLAKWDPKRYGERLTQEHTGPDGGPLVALLGQLGKSSLPVTPEDDE